MGEYKSRILVEGKSEQTVIPELCRLCGVQQRFDIEKANSLEELKRALKTLLKSSNTLTKLWVVIDADTHFERAWQSVKDILLRSGKYSFDSKMAMPSGGLIVEPDDPGDLTIGVWIMPNNTDVGMLEDFMLRLIPEGDTLIGRVERNVSELNAEREKHPGLFKEVHYSKARIHTWLAWHDVPGESLSVAVQKRLFAIDNDLCHSFAEWIGRLND